jgi:hypothetical protein
MPRIKINDREYEAREEEFEIFKEEWNEYRLLSGGRVRLKTSAQKIFQVLGDDGKPLRTPDGEPVMYVRHGTQVVATKPEGPHGN